MSHFIDIFPKITKMFPKIIEGLVWFGMSDVCAYHNFSETIFFNASFENSVGLEKVANVLLVPVHYLCNGKEIHYDEVSDTFSLTQRFNYDQNKMLYTPFALSTFSTSLVIGSLVKTVAFLSPEIRERHQNLRSYLTSSKTTSKNAYYRSLGIQVEDFQAAPYIDPPSHQRRPGDENHLLKDKEAFRDIVKLLGEHKIPFWVDCGTCLGAYRYGGIIPWDNDFDIAVIVDDFENVRHALNKLSKSKYAVQDWSNRGLPGTYIRVYIIESRSHLDIYHNMIDAENKTLTNILSNGESNFMAEGWKIRERMLCKPIPFDVIFPLKKANFDGIDVPIPNQTKTYLTYKYGPNIEPVMIYSDETDQYEKDLSHPYWMIPLAH